MFCDCGFFSAEQYTLLLVESLLINKKYSIFTYHCASCNVAAVVFSNSWISGDLNIAYAMTSKEVG